MTIDANAWSKYSQRARDFAIAHEEGHGNRDCSFNQFVATDFIPLLPNPFQTIEVLQYICWLCVVAIDVGFW